MKQKSRIRIPDHITDPWEQHRYLLARGECFESSDLIEQTKRLKGKCEVTFVVRTEGGGTKIWGVGKHQK